MKYWKVTYRWWHSVIKSIGYMQAETKKDVYTNFEKVNHFGYEDIDILSVEEITAEEILDTVVKKVEK